MPDAWSRPREVLFYDDGTAPATPGPVSSGAVPMRGGRPETKAWHLLPEDLTDSHRVAS